jgi:hypothetical protein
VFNFILSLTVGGVITASGAQYLVDLEDHSEKVASAYVLDATLRFAEYDKILPGIVNWVPKSTPSSVSKLTVKTIVNATVDSVPHPTIYHPTMQHHSTLLNPTL